MTSNKRNNLSVIMKPKLAIRMKIHRLPDIEGLTEEEINRASTSVKTKRRVAHVPKYPPVVRQPVRPVTAATAVMEVTEKPKEKEVPSMKILSSSELNAYMNRPIKERKIRTEVTVPWAYRHPTSSSVGAKVKEIKAKKIFGIKERALSVKKMRKNAKKFIL